MFTKPSFWRITTPISRGGASIPLVIIESPFENIFGALPETTEYANFIFNKLKLSNQEIEPELDQKIQCENEARLVRNCLDALTTNSAREDHREIWKNLISIKKTELNNLEQLFKLANAAMIMLACTGKKDYETCSLLPLSEKQIQVSFQKLNKELNHKYPAVFNLTTVDRLITYDNDHDHKATNGLLFYFSACQDSLKKLIGKENVLDTVHQNIGRYPQKKVH